MFDPSRSNYLSYTPPSNPSPNLKRFLSYVKALNDWNYEEVMNSYDRTLEHRILPKSLNRPVLNFSQYGQYFAGMMPLFKYYKMSIHEILEVGDGLSAHCSSVGQSISGAPYANEYMLILHFAPIREGETLPKIAVVKEFVDSAASLKFFAEERAKALARKEQSPH